MKEAYASQGMTDVQKLARGQGHGQGDPCLPRSSPTRREGPSRTQSHFSKACEMFNRPIAGTLCEASDKALANAKARPGRAGTPSTRG